MSLINNLRFLIPVVITLGIVRIQRAFFGTPLYLATPGTIDDLEGDFTEAVRYYSTAEEVAADLAAGNITARVAAALTLGFSQSPHVDQQAVGRIPGSTAQVTTITLAGTDPSDGDVFDVVYGGIASQYIATVPADTVQLVADGLFVELTADLADIAVVTQLLLVITITDMVGGVTRAVSSTTDSISTTIADDIGTAASSETAQSARVRLAESPAEFDVTSIDVDGVIASYTAGSGEDSAAVRDALFALLNGGASDITATHYVLSSDSGGDDIFIINKTGSTPSEILVATDSATTTIDSSIIQAATTPASLMDILFAEDAEWYVLSPQPRTDDRGYLKALAAWIEPSTTRARRMIGQSSASGILSGDSDSITEQLATLDYDRSSINYHGEVSEDMGLCWPAIALSYDLDVKPVTWHLMAPVGLTQPDLSTTQINTLKAANVGFLGNLKGIAAFHEGRFASGLVYNSGTSQDWLTARIEEDNADMLLSRTAQGNPIPFNSSGRDQVRSRVQGQLDISEQIGHLDPVVDPTTRAKISPVARVLGPSAEDLTLLRVRIGFDATVTKFVHEIDVSGTLD